MSFKEKEEKKKKEKVLSVNILEAKDITVKGPPKIEISSIVICVSFAKNI